jgi:hypothetical protein
MFNYILRPRVVFRVVIGMTERAKVEVGGGTENFVFTELMGFI